MFEKKIKNENKTKFVGLALEKLKIQFVCEECCLPVSLYGENIILSVYKDEFITHIYCDLHADEFLNEN